MYNVYMLYIYILYIYSIFLFDNTQSKDLSIDTHVYDCIYVYTSIHIIYIYIYYIVLYWGHVHTHII